MKESMIIKPPLLSARNDVTGSKELIREKKQ
jgi:hypothetical protein